MSWKPQVQVKGEGDKWHDNQLRFATKEEAEGRVNSMTWTLIKDRRVVESDDPVNYRWTDHGLEPCETSSSD